MVSLNYILQFNLTEILCFGIIPNIKFHGNKYVFKLIIIIY